MLLGGELSSMPDEISIVTLYHFSSAHVFYSRHERALASRKEVTAVGVAGVVTYPATGCMGRKAKISVAGIFLHC